ncbi:mechanosensitive ion channel family protein [Akkermansia glycaniphila]|uniref:Mechanosensitive ion channel n=1 Tax=Akkermansia glycaniphila TaxID=1679444 RepID=A0A1H6KYS5_9BACT|nr:mechanosensitive ion channel family protein [Akkermansia glycaniphila]MBT9449933.1 mechanosensitive ion channel family protein [Akkermansia glycaniphila]SEH78141.1 mechanosensitive ion channel [Akkermansia glycaniphila]
MEFFQSIADTFQSVFIESDKWKHIALAIIYLIAGYIAVKTLRRILIPVIRKTMPRQIGRLLQNVIGVAIWTIALIQALSAMGIDVVSILGAAGVVGIAIGFASQTSLSNLISGIFLVGEKSVNIGDTIQISGFTGTIENIGLLSVKLRQADNAVVRVPNETLIKTPVVNITGDTLRRCDFDIGVAYDSDLSTVERLIHKVVTSQDTLATEPAPVVQFVAFADSALSLRVGAWCKTGDYLQARMEFAKNILQEFKEHGINIPFPIRTVEIVGNTDTPS